MHQFFDYLRSKITPFFSKNTRVAEIPTWNPPDDFKSKLSLDDLKFIFEQAEKKLKDTVEESSVIVNRNSTLINLITGSLIAIFGFIISRINDFTKIDEMLVTSVVGVLYLFILGVFTFNSLKPKTYLVSGSTPEDNFNERYFQSNVPDEKRTLVYYMNEIINYQFKIEQNSKVNIKRWKRFNLSLFMLIMFPAYITLTYIVTKTICFQ